MTAEWSDVQIELKLRQFSKPLVPVNASDNQTTTCAPTPSSVDFVHPADTQEHEYWDTSINLE